MAYCTTKLDHPLRVQFGPGLVVHAAREILHGPYSRSFLDSNKVRQTENVPARKVVRTACSSWRETDRKHVIKNTTPITCKNCSKRLGLERVKPSPKRYVVTNTETGEFYKSGRHCGSWVEDILDSTLYKVRGVAEKLTTKRYYIDGYGNEISWNEYIKLRSKDKGVTEKRRKDPKRDMKTVTIVLD